MVPLFTSRKGPNSGNIIDLLSWVIDTSIGPARWCDDVTYDADKTITQLCTTAKNFTLNVGKTLTAAALRPLIIFADIASISGTITASGKGCPAVTETIGQRCTSPEWPFFNAYGTEASQNRNYCLCGSGGGSASMGGSKEGGGAYNAGGAIGAAGNACDLTDAELKELLLSPLFNIFQVGLGGSGGGLYPGEPSGVGGGLILLFARIVILAPTANILANGLGTSNSSGAGGGGFVGLFGESLSVDPSATITTDKGVGSGAGHDGGDGAIAQIEA